MQRLCFHGSKTSRPVRGTEYSLPKLIEWIPFVPRNAKTRERQNAAVRRDATLCGAVLSFSVLWRRVELTGRQDRTTSKSDCINEARTKSNTRVNPRSEQSKRSPGGKRQKVPSAKTHEWKELSVRLSALGNAERSVERTFFPLQPPRT